MQRKKASDFDRRILELYDGYVHGRMSKRDFLEHAAKYTAGTAGALAVLGQLQPDYALAQQVAPDDPAIVTERVEYPSPEGHGTVSGPDGAAGGRRRAAAGGAGRAREPRAQPLHRGRGAAAGQGRLPRARAGRPDLGRRLSGHRRRGPGAPAGARPGEADGGLLRRLRVSGGARGLDRPGRLRRLLLRRRGLQRAGGRLSGARRRRCRSTAARPTSPTCRRSRRR